MGELFSIEDLSFAYPGRDGWALRYVSLTLRRGEFFLLCGPSGGGKTTLLRLLSPVLSPHGRQEGTVRYGGRALSVLPRREACGEIAFVGQSPENQIVTDKVRTELSFGPENLGFSQADIRRSVAEAASLFGLSGLLDRDTAALSGGQKQLVNLAAAVAVRPKVLLLDEPTAQLDPVAAGELLSALWRLSREQGMTVVLSEHRLEEAFPMADRVGVLDRGSFLAVGAPREIGAFFRETGHPMSEALPAAMRVWAGASPSALAECPVSAGEGRRWLMEYSAAHPVAELDWTDPQPRGEALLTAKGLWYRYEKAGPDVLRGASLVVRRGEASALMGGNGGGKTTLLKLLCGALTPYRGRVECAGRVAFLPQDPCLLFGRGTLREELLEAGIKEDSFTDKIKLCGLEGLLDRHPYDLSGGERQRAALCRLLLADPEILLLDEPTKGLDFAAKEDFAAILRQLLDGGAGVLLASHDMEFCARYAHRCGLLFDGEALSWSGPHQFFAGGSFYTTAANRMAGELLPNAILPEEVAACCRGGDISLPPTGTPGGEGGRSPKTEVPDEPGPDSAKEKPPKGGGRSRRLLGGGALLLLSALTLALGVRFWGGKGYYATSLLIVFECLAFFLGGFERRRPQARELASLSSLCALAVAGRAAFFAVPQCKPVLAVTVVSGAAFGGEAGFLVGALSMLLSNFLFSQGPWTPWQMFAMGLCGFFGGLLFRKAAQRELTLKIRLFLGVYGFLSAVVLYGGVMNLSSALTWNGDLTLGVLLTYLASGFPMDCIHGAASAAFLWLGGGPLLKVLQRVKGKYGFTGQ